MATLSTTVNNDVNGHLASFAVRGGRQWRIKKKNYTEQPQRQIEIRNGDQPNGQMAKLVTVRLGHCAAVCWISSAR